MADFTTIQYIHRHHQQDLLWSAGPAAVVLDVSRCSDPTDNDGYPSTDQVEP